MRRLFRACCSLLAVIGTLAGFQTSYAADKWVAVRSRNFLLVGNANESAIRRVGRNLEEFRSGFSLLFPSIGKQTPPPITVFVFKDDASFRPFKPLHQGKPASLDGFFMPGPAANFIALTAATQTPHVVYHEFVHSLTKDNVLVLPTWASEGLAEFYGMFEIDSSGKEMLLGRPMVDHIETLRRSFLSVESLFAVDHDSPFYNEQTKQGIFYAESWAVMHYLMLGNSSQYQPQLAKFLTAVGTGKPTGESFREAFQKDYLTLEKELQSYISRFTFPVIRYKLQTKIDFDREMQVSSLTDAQVQFHLGDLLLHIGRLDTAEEYLGKAVSLDSNLAPGFASLGMLRMQQDKDEEALKFLTKAVQADSKDYMVHYYYAFMLQSTSDAAAGPQESRYQLMRQHLKKSIELAPGYFNAYGMLGYVALMLQDELRETERLLMKVLESSPGRRDIRLRLAELMVANKEAQAARVVLQPMKEGEDDTLKQQARSLLDNIETYLENDRAFREYQERRQEAEKVAAHAAAAALVADVPLDEPDDRPPVITRKEAKPASEGGVVETAAPKLNRPAGQQIEGALLSADCSHGLTLRVRVGNGNVELHSDNASNIEFLSFTTAVSETFACGTFKSPPPVLIVYRRSADARYLGEPVRVEFIDKK